MREGGERQGMPQSLMKAASITEETMGIFISIIILKPEELTWSRVQITNK
ncbi:hypothetical protein NC651_004545 [Populus alba x Populus x berolinensis]|nr:hypothetical protein NC651_004545 [Populus alba x Populus x berolinensis]